MTAPFVSPEEKKQIQKAIRVHLPGCRILGFGSRISGSPKRYSDLDLALDNGAPIGFAELGYIKEMLAETNIPYLVDVSDFHRLDSDFQDRVLRQCESW